MKKLLLIPLFFIFLCSCESNQNTSTVSAPSQPSIKVAPIETELEYISSTKPIVGRQNIKGIYYKEFLKNHLKFKGTRINVLGKIFQIEETENKSGLQMYIDDQRDDVMIYYKGTTNLYKGDFVRIYGEVGDDFEGKNAFGAFISAPIINARYLKKVNLSEE